MAIDFLIFDEKVVPLGDFVSAGNVFARDRAIQLRIATITLRQLRPSKQCPARRNDSSSAAARLFEARSAP
jgi:hypothetical protein